MKERTYIIRNADQRDKFIEKLRQWEVKKPLVFTVQPYRKQRDAQKNAMLHGVFRQISDKMFESGWTEDKVEPEWWKERVKAMFLGQETVEIMGEPVTRTRRTRDLTNGEVVRLVEDVAHYFGAQYGIEIIFGAEYYEMKQKLDEEEAA